MTKRIQLSRKKGWRKPEGCIVVSRPSPFGNPFRINGPIAFCHGATRCPKSNADAVNMYRNWTMKDGRDFAIWRNRVRKLLGGHDLACWCPLDQPCHVDVLLEIANSPMEPESRHE